LNYGVKAALSGCTLFADVHNDDVTNICKLVINNIITGSFYVDGIQRVTSTCCLVTVPLIFAVFDVTTQESQLTV